MINILDSKIYNRIAAGEVIERPRSIVKELIENSIDAGAKQITLEIKDGGISLIKVTDDGCGMDSEDLKKAFLPHATSKIHSLKDLDSIITLGFRGEALASIASVAKAEMRSRQSGAEMGAVIIYDNGEMIDFGECGCPEGTTIKVENIFENIPARKKFLDKPVVEEHEIRNLIVKLIIANPDISFRYISDDDIIFISNGQGMKAAVYSVYGSEFYNNLIEIENISPEISLKGYIGKTTFSKHNRTFQSLIVNGRYVINSEISYIIQNYYSEYLMTRQFPVYILYLNLPPDMLDVNIHPNKMEVKFSDFKKVKQVISSTIKEALNGPSVQATEVIINRLFGEKDEKSSDTNVPENREEVKKNLEPQNIDAPIKSGSLPKTVTLEETRGSVISLTPKPQIILPKEEKPLSEISEFQNIGNNIKIIGRAFNTYIFIEKENNLYIIDQHASHERYLFDKLTKQYDCQKNTQQLLFPYVFEISYEEVEDFKTAITELEKLGFKFEERKEMTFALSSIPAVLSEININDFIVKLTEELKIGKIPQISSLMRDKLATIACKAAIKGNYELSQQEIIALINEIGELKILQCPHGRPLIIKISKYELEKWFKRKV